jgi:hypothetical protein
VKYKVGDLIIGKRWSDFGYLQDVNNKLRLVTIILFENPHIQRRHTIFYLEQNYEVISNRQIK